MLTDKKTFGCGLASAIICYLGWGAIVSIILALISLSAHKKFVAQNGAETGRSKAGKIMATIALIVSIVAIVVNTIIVIVAAVNGGLS